MLQNLEQLITECWTTFNAFNPSYKVNPSIPILWFGDMEAYLKSQKRIVTVALNPSGIEFQTKRGASFSISARFPGFSLPFTTDNYYETLNQYFKKNPYWSWFASPENILNCLDASYKPGRKNTAIHLDIYAPVATAPHWNGLSQTERKQLVAVFGNYFDKLMDILNPDIILASLKRSEIKSHFVTDAGVGCEPANSSKSWCPKDKKGFDLRRYQLKGGQTLITGRNMRGYAFGGLTPEECQKGMSILQV